MSSFEFGFYVLNRNNDYVFCGFFLAAGNNTLFRISLKPGELGCKSNTVGSSPTLCW